MNNLLFIKITILSQVTSLQPIATLDFVLLLNISGDSYSFNANNSSIAFINDIISISATLFHWMYTNETTFIRWPVGVIPVQLCHDHFHFDSANFSTSTLCFHFHFVLYFDFHLGSCADVAVHHSKWTIS